MAKPFFSGRIPQELDDRIKERIQETGETKSQILINALSQYLEKEPVIPRSEINAKLAQLDIDIRELRSVVRKIGLELMQLKQSGTGISMGQNSVKEENQQPESLPLLEILLKDKPQSND